MGSDLRTENSSVSAAKRHRALRYDELFRSKRSKPTASAAADVSTAGLGFQIRGPNSSVSLDLGSDCSNNGNIEPTPGLCDTKGECEIAVGNDEKVCDRINASNSRNKPVPGSSLRRKLFKMLASHSQLLPFLTDTTNDGIPKTEKLDLGTQDKGDHSDGLTLKASENEQMKNFGSELSPEAQNLDDRNLSKIVEETWTHEDSKQNKNGACSNGYEENIQKTPPHMVSFCNLEMNMVENEGNPKHKIAVGNDNFARESTHKDICLESGFTFKRKMVLNPCSWQKLLKTPSSFSYKRLLPYFTNVSNNNPNNSFEYSPHQAVTTVTEGKNTNTHLPAVDLNCQQIDKSETSHCSIGHSGSKLSLNPPTDIPISDSSYIKQALSAEKSTELQKPFDSPNRCVLPVEHVISTVINDLEHAYGGENSEIKMTSPPILSCSSGDDGNRLRDDAQSNSSQDTNALESECLHKMSSQVQESFPFDNHVNSKGILRRNPRGCRGLCNCLNCTSFRLNADRAFEFSRNQMLDAEEVAFDLINELSSLRSILKEFIVNSNGHADIDQVRKACTKALKAEESAKFRLKEMHSDLNAHCNRKLLKRPCVKFTNHVTEMVILQTELPAGDKKAKRMR